MKPGISRRAVLLAGAGCGLLTAGWLGFNTRHSLRGRLLSAFEDARADQYIGGLSLDDTTLFGARIPVRAHGCAVHPLDPQRVLFFARRPGIHAFELDCVTGQARQVLQTPQDRHLAGHGVYSPQGDWLYIPEYDYEQQRGVITVRDSRHFKVAEELDSGGLDPHELAWLPDGGLLIANGGILTHPRSFRRKLNLDTMASSVCVLDPRSGTRRQHLQLADHQLSIRHLAMADDGTTALGLQYEGTRQPAPGVVALYRPAGTLQLLSAPPDDTTLWRGYVASIALSTAQDVIAAACPFGSGVACWSLSSGKYMGFIDSGETYGLALQPDGSLLASQRDGSANRIDLRLSQQASAIAMPASTLIRWDDHWRWQDTAVL